jgi:hypothetical protein
VPGGGNGGWDGAGLVYVLRNPFEIVSLPTPFGVARPPRRGLAGRMDAAVIRIESIEKFYKIDYMVSNVKSCQ